jgi:hypothetical protein
MTPCREERGTCVIEASALYYRNGSHWQPWLRLTRRARGVFASDTFDALKPVFGTEQAALGYAAELGRTMADEGRPSDSAARNQAPATWPLQHAFARPCTYRYRAQSLRFARIFFSATQ